MSGPVAILRGQHRAGTALNARRSSAGECQTQAVVLYDAIGATYGATRVADPRIAAQIDAALGDAQSVLNVGAGSSITSHGSRISPTSAVRCQPDSSAHSSMSSTCKSSRYRRTAPMDLAERSGRDPSATWNPAFRKACPRWHCSTTDHGHHQTNRGSSFVDRNNDEQWLGFPTDRVPSSIRTRRTLMSDRW
jgi:hypothetical protein